MNKWSREGRRERVVNGAAFRIIHGLRTGGSVRMSFAGMENKMLDVIKEVQSRFARKGVKSLRVVTDGDEALFVLMN